MPNITREREAGKLYSEGRKAVQSGGLELHTLAMHLIIMIKGTPEFEGPLWPVRELSDGKIVKLDRFVDYLLRPVRDGLELPSMYFLKQTLEATMPAKDGDRALAMVRAELTKEHVDFDKQAKLDAMKLHGEREALPEIERGKVRSDRTNLQNRGENSSYLAARLKRDHPEIAERLANGEFRSIRAAAIEAKIITVKTPLEQLLWRLDKLPESDQRRVLHYLEKKFDPVPTHTPDDPNQISLFPARRPS